MEKKIQTQIEILSDGVKDLFNYDDLRIKLEKSLKTKTPMIIKSGIDPTAEDIHLGHTVLLNKMRQFQDLGHRVAFVVGDATAMVGDPTGRSKTRKKLTREEILSHAKHYAAQSFKILDPEKTEIMFNSRWLFEIDLLKLVDLSSKYSVSEILQREDFSKRMEEKSPVFLHEMLYPLLQGYDSVMLKADVEIGGSDQKFNLMVGRKLQQDFGMKSQIVMTVPLLPGIDGVKKMSKSAGNYIGIGELPDTMFTKIMSISDELLWKYYEMLTSIDSTTVEAMKAKTKNDSTSVQQYKLDLAKLITAKYHGDDLAAEAFDNFHRDVPENLPEFQYPFEEQGVKLLKIMHRTKLAMSIRDAEDLVRDGRVYINSQKITDPYITILVKEPFILKINKINTVRIVLV